MLRATETKSCRETPRALPASSRQNSPKTRSSLAHIRHVERRRETSRLELAPNSDCYPVAILRLFILFTNLIAAVLF